MQRFKAVVITGMTGSGKTELAMAVANHLNGELVCGDTTQMHRGLATLTNKTQSFGQIPSHLYSKYDDLNG